jgi:hypothetical protein
MFAGHVTPNKPERGSSIVFHAEARHMIGWLVPLCSKRLQSRNKIWADSLALTCVKKFSLQQPYMMAARDARIGTC